MIFTRLLFSRDFSFLSLIVSDGIPHALYWCIPVSLELPLFEHPFQSSMCVAYYRWRIFICNLRFCFLLVFSTSSSFCPGILCEAGFALLFVNQPLCSFRLQQHLFVTLPIQCINFLLKL
jgi:hypothetical protein